MSGDLAKKERGVEWAWWGHPDIEDPDKVGKIGVTPTEKVACRQATPKENTRYNGKLEGFDLNKIRPVFGRKQG